LLSLDVTEIRSLERRLAYYVGPVARLLVKRAASKATNREELTQMLAAEVEAAPARKQFLEACRNDWRRISLYSKITVCARVLAALRVAW